MQLSRLLLLLSTIATATFAAPNKPHELVARLPKSSALWTKLSGQNVDIFGATTSTLDVRVTKAQLDTIVTENNIDNSAVKILIPDLDKLIAEERERLRSAPQEGIEGDANVDWHTEYHTYEDIKKFVGKLAQDNPDLAKFSPSIGKTIEGRDLFMLKITGTGGDYAKKQRAFMVCMQHAREWIAGATAQYLAEHLISAYKAGDQRIVKLLDQVEFVIVPVSNPDGYAHTWTSGGRMWRKNRARNAKGRIVGVDVNRNWPAHWGQVGASRDENSETYGGVAPASELETQALIKAFKSTPNVYFSIDLHSYSEVFMRPWAYLTDDKIRTPHESQFLQITDKFIESVKKVKGTTYTALTRLYPVSGGARDWAYDEGKAYSVTIELSPDSDSDIGFVLPPTEIKRVGEEMWNGIVTAAETALTLPKIA